MEGVIDTISTEPGDTQRDVLTLASRSLNGAGFESEDGGVNVRALVPKLAYFSQSVEDRRVITATEVHTDFHERQRRQLSREHHSDLSSVDDRANFRAR